MGHGFVNPPKAVALFFWLALSFSCTGEVGDVPEDPASPSSAIGAGSASRNPGAHDGTGPMPIRRLDREELNNTLRDLIADTSGAAYTLPQDSRGSSGFFEGSVVSTNYVEYLIDLVETLSGDLTKRMPGLVGCDPISMGEDTCADRFVTRFGRHAYRRPLDKAEMANLIAYFKQVKTTLKYPFYEAMRVVVEGMLMSPNFLYHRELGPQAAKLDKGLVPLTADEAASRLSYFLWGSMPDDALFAAVDGGRLATPADLDREARRMLASSKAHARIGSFHTQWLGLENIVGVQKDPKQYPGFDSALAKTMVDEMAEFSTRTILEGDGTLGTLLTSPKAYVNDRLGRIYGAPGVTSKTTLVPVTLDPTRRAGLLTRAAFLSVHAGMADPSPKTPMRRGKMLYVGVLCGTLPPPPDQVPPFPAQPPPTSTARDIVETHDRNPCTTACHRLFDPLGLAFGQYDMLGRYRTMEGGKPVDASGTLFSPLGAEPRPFKDAGDLIGILAESEDVRRCMVKQWFRFALKRAETPEDEASLETAYEAFSRSNYKIRELMVALSQTRAFAYRSAAPGEVLR